jgi:hypothetical protein
MKTVKLNDKGDSIFYFNPREIEQLNIIMLKIDDNNYLTREQSEIIENFRDELTELYS